MNTAKPHLAVSRSEFRAPSSQRLRIRIDLGQRAAGCGPQGFPPAVPAPPREEPKTLDIKIGTTIHSYRYWKTKWTNKKSRRVYNSYVMTWFDGLKPRREKRNSFKKLRARAEEIATLQENNDTARLQLTPADQAGFMRARERAAQVGAPVELLVSEAVEARKRSLTFIVGKTCPQIVTELLAAKRAEGAGVRWVDDLDSRLNRFTKDFKTPLESISSEEIRLWLTRLNLSKRSFNNYRTALLALARFARERKYLSPHWEGLAAIKPFEITKPIEELYTPEEIRSLLFTAEKYFPQHLPALAIMAFAGCRHCELRDQDGGLDWKDVHLKTAQIHISAALAKSHTGRRYVPIQPNLAAWIEFCARPRGPVCTVANLTNAFARIADRAKVTWKQNALRNSFISYRCAVTQNVPQVAGEAGNSVGEIQKSYRKELTKEEGESWFNIWPTRSAALPLFAYGGNRAQSIPKEKRA
jgi:integrase